MPESQEAASLREVHTLIAGLRTELLSEFKQLEAMVDVRFERHESEHATHEADHKAHEARHEHEKDHRASMIRWVITTLMSGLGVLLAIYIAVITRH